MDSFLRVNILALSLFLTFPLVLSSTTVFAEESLVDLPNFISSPEKIIENNETVAGNEQIVEPAPESAVTNSMNQNPVVAQNNASVNQNNTTIETNTEGQPPEVLSENTTQETSDVGQVIVPESNINDEKPIQAVSNSKVYLYYFIAGLIVFIGLVTFLLMAMKKQKK